MLYFSRLVAVRTQILLALMLWLILLICVRKAAVAANSSGILYQLYLDTAKPRLFNTLK